jgi:hypothetical protein
LLVAADIDTAKARGGAEVGANADSNANSAGEEVYIEEGRPAIMFVVLRAQSCSSLEGPSRLPSRLPSKLPSRLPSRLASRFASGFSQRRDRTRRRSSPIAE